MDTFSSRLKLAMSNSGKKAVDIARVTGVSSAGVKKWLDGNVANPKFEDVYKIACLLKVNTNWLGLGKGLMRNNDYEDDSNIVEIVKLEISASCGTGNDIAIESPQAFVLSINETWFKLNFPYYKPKDLRIITARGDSMSPLIEDGDIVFIDITQNAIIREGIFFLNFDEQYFIKRVQILGKNSLVLISENRRYRDIEINEESQLVFKPIGRVIKSLKPQDFR